MRVERVTDFESGQFMMIYNDGGVRRPYSIASSPSENFLEFFIQEIPGGQVSPFLFSLKEGDEVELEGPFGRFTLGRSQSSRKIFIATGTGVAPLRSMILYLIETRGAEDITLIYGSRFLEEFVYNDEFMDLSHKYPFFKYYPILSRPSKKWKGKSGYVQDVFGEVDFEGTDVFISGNPKIVREIKDKIKGARDIFVEMY